MIPETESSKLSPYKHLLTNKNIYHYNFPIPDRGVPSAMNLTAFINYMIILLKGGWKVYLHCLGGHGRTGLIVSMILGYYKGLSANDSLNYCQALHFRRWKQVNERKKPKCYLSPSTNDQFKLVRRLLN